MRDEKLPIYLDYLKKLRIFAPKYTNKRMSIPTIQETKAKNKVNHWIFIFVLLIISANAFSQKTQKVTATYTYYAPENVTLEEAKCTALERAKLKVIADEFGTIISQSSSTMISNENGKSDSRFFSLGNSEVKGEWIETTNEPTYDVKYDGGMLIVSVIVKGRIREIVSADIDYTAKILRNGTEEKFESSEFRNGDDMFLYFKSPVNGYLTVFLLDESLMEVYYLLPYRASGEGAYRIEHDTSYTFFSIKNETSNPRDIDEYVMTCTRDIEYNDIYIVFSPNTFAKANALDLEDNRLLPRQVSYEGFQKWLTKLRTKDKEASVLKKSITIKK